MIRPPRRATLLLVPAALALLAGCTGVVGADAFPAVRSTDGAVVTAGSIDVFSLRPGDCLDEPSGDRVLDATVVPCETGHDLQIYSAAPAPGEEYTSPGALRTTAATVCESAFDATIGIGYRDSALEYRSLVPSALSWRHGDRALLCAVYDPAGPVTGTLLGAAR